MSDETEYLSSGLDCAGAKGDIGDGNEFHGENKVLWPTMENEASQSSTLRFISQFHFEYNTPAYSPVNPASVPPLSQNTILNGPRYSYNDKARKLMDVYSPVARDIFLNPFLSEPSDQSMQDATFNLTDKESSSSGFPGASPPPPWPPLFETLNSGVYIDIDSEEILTPPMSGGVIPPQALYPALKPSMWEGLTPRPQSQGGKVREIVSGTPSPSSVPSLSSGASISGSEGTPGFSFSPVPELDGISCDQNVSEIRETESTARTVRQLRRDYRRKKKGTKLTRDSWMLMRENNYFITPPESRRASEKEDETSEVPTESKSLAPQSATSFKDVMSNPLRLRNTVRQHYGQLRSARDFTYMQKSNETSGEKDPDPNQPNAHTPIASSPSILPLGNSAEPSTDISSNICGLSYDHRIPYFTQCKLGNLTTPALSYLRQKQARTGDENFGAKAVASPSLKDSPLSPTVIPVPTVDVEPPSMSLGAETPVAGQTYCFFTEQPIGSWAPPPQCSDVDERYYSLQSSEQPTELTICEDTIIGDLDTSTPVSSPGLGLRSPGPLEKSNTICIESLPSSPSDDGPGYQEEIDVKVAVLYILIQYFLLQEYHLKSQSASTTPFSRSSSSAENYPDSQLEQGDNLEDQEENGESHINCTEGSEITEIEGNQTQESHENSQKRKRDDQEDAGRGDDDDQRSNKKRSKKKDLNSLGSRLACPFAKGNPSSHPSCALIGRQDLAGVKEHLKRNHFDKKLPPAIRACKTWDRVFRVCIPDWDHRNPIPSPYLNIGYEILRPVTGVPLPTAGNFALGCETPQHLSLNNTTRGNITSPTAGPAFNGVITTSQAPSTINQPPASGGFEEGLVHTDNPYFTQPLPEESQNAMGNTQIQNNLEPVYQPALTGQFGFSQALNEWIKPRAAPHMAWPPGPEFAEAFNSMPQYLLNYGVDMNLPPAELFPVLQNELNIPNTDLPYPGTLPNNPPLGAAFPPTPSLRTDPPASFVSPNSSACTPSLTQSRSDGSSVTALSTPPAPRNEPGSNRYTLMVARKHPISGSTEVQGPKQFDFDSYENFKMCFESWILATFTDPLFSWETMEFVGADPEVTSRLSDVTQVLMDIRMYHMRYRTTNATLLLVSKDKGKQKASP